MNAQPVYILQNGEYVQGVNTFYCQQCMRIHTHPSAETARGLADDCCKPYMCQVCGVEVQRYHSRCDACAEESRQQEFMQRIMRTACVHPDQYDGPVYEEQTGRYYFSYDEYIEEIEDRRFDYPAAQPQPVFAVRFVKPQISWAYLKECIIERLGEDYGNEDGEVNFKGDLSGISRAVAQFNNRQEETIWMVNDARVVWEGPCSTSSL